MHQSKMLFWDTRKARLPISIPHHHSPLISLVSILAQPLSSHPCNYRLHHISHDVSFDKTPNSRANVNFFFPHFIFKHACVFVCK